MIIPLIQVNHTRLFYTKKKWRIREYGDNRSPLTWKFSEDKNMWIIDFRTRCRTINIQRRIRQLRMSDE